MHMNDIIVRWMIRRDMPDVLRIEQDSFDKPWNEETFLRCLRLRNCIFMIAERPGEDGLGFIIYELHQDQLKMLRLVVAPEHRREGVGRALIERLTSKLSSHRRTRIAIDVPERWLPAQVFFRGLGFRAVGVVRGSSHDAYRMEYCLPGIQSEHRPVNRLLVYS